MERKERINQNFELYLSYLKRMIQHKSVLNDDAKPFGKGINGALDEVLKISEELGYNTYRDPEGYYGYAEIGEGAKLFGVLGHVDVVKEGDLADWESDPFDLVIKGGRLIGRGTSDDKGPVIASLLALKMLLDEGHKLTSRVRFIFGTDEENLWRCLDAYKEKEVLPDLGFTPDADFPLVNLEKGMLQLILETPINEEKAIVGGDSMNAVPGHASAKLRDGLLHALDKHDRRYEIKDNITKVYGKAAHASTPEEGENAIYYLAKGLSESQDPTNVDKFISDFYDEEPLNIFKDEMSGIITYNMGVASYNDGKQRITLDLRYPVSFTKEQIISGVKEFAYDYNFTVEEYSSLPSIYLPEDHPLVSSCLKAYQDVTGDKNAQPLRIGGATYARAMPNIVAFGPMLPGAEGSAHQANEYIKIDDIKVAMEVYMNAFEMLV